MGDVGIEVERDADFGMAEHFGHHLGMDTGTEREGRGGMPQVVEADGRQGLIDGLGEGEEAVEVAHEILGLDRGTAAGSKNPSSVLPSRSSAHGGPATGARRVWRRQPCAEAGPGRDPGGWLRRAAGNSLWRGVGGFKTRQGL